MGGGGHAPKAYTPANQPGADSAYYGTLSNLTQQDTATSAITNAGYNAAYQGVVSNPYDASMLAGINAAAGTANNVAASDLSQAGAMNTAAGQGYADANTARGYAAPMATDAAALRAYAPMLAEYGFDPNMSEYNYGLKQTQDTQNVQNAEQGIAGSPFAAGATGDAMSAYTRNYQVAQASKAMQALAALSALSTTAGGLDTSAIAGLTSAGNMDTNAANLAAQGSALAHTGAQTQATAATLPYATSNQIYDDRMAALDEMAQGSATTGGDLRGDVTGYGNYLAIGQGATSLDQNAAKINAENSFMGQLGALIGTLGPAAMKLLPQGG